MKQNWKEFKGLFTDILMNEKIVNKLLTKKFLKIKNRVINEGMYKGKIVHSTFGLCYVLSECAYHMLGGKEEGWKPMFINHLGYPHWFLKHDSGFILDLTAEQFETTPDYDRAIGKGFLTKTPCKRSMILLNILRSNINFMLSYPQENEIEDFPTELFGAPDLGSLHFTY